MRLPGLTVTSVATIALGMGCLRSLPFNHYVLRAPQIMAGNLGEVRVGGRCGANVDGLRVRVSALGAGTSLLIVLNLDVDTRGYTFDPTQTVLAVHGQGRVPPAAYVGPGRMNWVAGTYRECVPFDDHTPPLRRRSDPAAHTLPTHDTCFVLEYPFRPLAAGAADLELAGLTKLDAPLAPTRFWIGATLWSNVIDVQAVSRP